MFWSIEKKSVLKRASNYVHNISRKTPKIIYLYQTNWIIFLFSFQVSQYNHLKLGDINIVSSYKKMDSNAPKFQMQLPVILFSL